METQEPIMTPQESLQVIQNMINAAKRDTQGNAFHFLFWGWLVFITCMTQYLLITVFHVENSDRVWWSMVFGGIVSVIYSIKDNKAKGERTYSKYLLKHVWLAFGISWGIILFFGQMQSGTGVLSVCMILYGIGLYVSGAVLQFKPLMFGGSFNWLCAIAGFFITDVQILLVLAIAVLGGYIIPGHILNKKRNESVQRS